MKDGAVLAIGAAALAAAGAALARSSGSRAALAGRVVHRFPDGWTVQDLFNPINPILLISEGQALQNTVLHPIWFEGMLRGKWRVQSLRRPDGESMLTLIVTKDNRVGVARGHWDRLPGSFVPGFTDTPTTVREELTEKLTEELLQTECEHLVAYVRTIQPTGPLRADVRACMERLGIEEEED